MIGSIANICDRASSCKINLVIYDYLGGNLLSLSVISIPPTTKGLPAKVVVGLHGWGANGEDLASLASFLELSNYQFFFPDAPFPHPYSSEGKMWYSFAQTPAEAAQGAEELGASQELLQNWLTTLPETTGVPLESTILMGFSQGGAMALDLGFQLPVGGLVILSGYLHPLPQRNSGSTVPPILMVHGKQDNVVPVTSARLAKTTLEAMKAQVNYYEFEMAHEIRSEVLPIIKDFIEKLG
jgi:phospholipase/carboxylesterase